MPDGDLDEQGVSEEEYALARRYPMVIQWDHRDSIFVVSIPDFPRALGHGATPEAAAQQGAELSVVLVTAYIDAGLELPEPTDMAQIR